MPRILDPAAHAVRRDAFVDVAERIIRTQGYEHLSIQGVLEALGTSKGAFYHYFDSKAALLDAVVERMVDHALAAVAGTLDDPALTAMERLRGLFDGIAQWKWQRSDLVLGILRAWHSDENAIVREKVRRRILAELTPRFTGIVEQGRTEGTFAADVPADTGRILATLLLSVNEFAADLFLDAIDGRVTLDEVERSLRAYPEACERLLGLAPGTFPFIDRDALRPWFH